MPRARRKPAPPGRVLVVCTGRGDHAERRLATLQVAAVAGGEAEFLWRGKPPVTGYAHADGSQTYVFGCGLCHRRPECSRDRLARLVLAVAAVQGGWDKPVTVDISTVERAI